MRLVIACGGTGGHLFPGLAVAEEVCKRGGTVLLFISEKQIDSLAVRDHRDHPQIQFEKLPSIGLPPLFSLAMLRFGASFLKSLYLARHYYRAFQPNAVLGMGGFTSSAPILAGRLNQIPTFVHESNAIIGKANRINALLAQKTLLGFEECRRFLSKKSSSFITGTPIRASLQEAILSPKNRADYLSYFGWEESPEKVLLVMGGSQGAEGINRHVIASLPEWKNLPLRIIHLTGSANETAVRAAYENAGFPSRRVFIAPFCHEMQNAYAIANLAISRSGAASLSELSSFGIPSILIPYPPAAEDHQTLNAKIFANINAAILLQEKEINASQEPILVNTVKSLCEDSTTAAQRLRTMADAVSAIAPRNATSQIVDVIEKFSQARL